MPFNMRYYPKAKYNNLPAYIFAKYHKNKKTNIKNFNHRILVEHISTILLSAIIINDIYHNIYHNSYNEYFSIVY